MNHIFIQGEEYKECTKCHKILLLQEYRKDSTKKDGLSCSCKQCLAIKDKENYEKNPKKKYEKVKEYMKRTGYYYKSKPYNKAYYSSEKSKNKKRLRDLRRKELEKRARKEKPITKEVINILIERSGGNCEYCGKDCIDNYHIDHKIPLFRGGTNDISNLAFSCPRCNLSKGKKTVEEYESILSKSKN